MSSRMVSRTVVTQLRKALARTRGKLTEAQAELKWRRKAMRGSRAERAHYDQVRAEQDAVFAGAKRMYAERDKIKKVTALANDARGNANERAVAATMADKLRAKKHGFTHLDIATKQ